MGRCLARLALLLFPLLLGLAAPGLGGEAPLPIADTHLHYNQPVWDQLSPERAIDLLASAGVAWAISSSTPPDGSERLQARVPTRVVSFFRPYLSEAGRSTWPTDPEVLRRAGEALASGRYGGIGEVHLYRRTVGPRATAPVLRALLKLAAQRQLPVQVHVDEPELEVLAAVATDYPTVRILWTHAGGWSTPARVREVLERFPNVWADFAARDPYRYGAGAGRIVDDHGQLQPEWRSLVLAFPDRFMIGSDTGRLADWERLADIMAFHRRWLAGLPPGVAERIAWRNAFAFLGLPSP
jgi:hypothetical protein